MEISNLTLKLILLLVPGAIAAKIISRVTVQQTISDFQFVVNSILFGTLSYLSLQFICAIGLAGNELIHARKPDFKSYSLEIWDNMQKSESIPFNEIFFSSVIAIVLGFIIGGVDHHKYINKFAQKWKISNKYGDENLYSYFLNAQEIEEVYVRSIKNGLTYHGFVNGFSERSDLTELTLTNVTVYSYPASEELYSVDYIYLSFAKHDIIIEALNAQANEQAT